MLLRMILMKPSQLKTYSELPDLPVVDQMMFGLRSDGVCQPLSNREGERQWACTKAYIKYLHHVKKKH